MQCWLASEETHRARKTNETLDGRLEGVHRHERDAARERTALRTGNAAFRTRTPDHDLSHEPTRPLIGRGLHPPDCFTGVHFYRILSLIRSHHTPSPNG